jgi:hypothetical protein
VLSREIRKRFHDRGFVVSVLLGWCRRQRVELVLVGRFGPGILGIGLFDERFGLDAHRLGTSAPSFVARRLDIPRFGLVPRVLERAFGQLGRRGGPARRPVIVNVVLRVTIVHRVALERSSAAESWPLLRPWLHPGIRL